MRVTPPTKHFVALVLLIPIAACGRTATRTAAPGSHDSRASSARPASSVDAGSDSGEAEAAPEATAKLRFEADVGCEQDTDRSKTAAAQLEALQARCAPGMRPMLREARRAHVGSAATTVVELTLAADSCVRVGTTTQPSGEAIEVKMTGPGIRDPMERRARGPMLLGRDGPTCVREAGSYTLQLRAVGRSVDAWVQAWTTEAPPPAASR